MCLSFQTSSAVWTCFWQLTSFQWILPADVMFQIRIAIKIHIWRLWRFEKCLLDYLKVHNNFSEDEKWKDHESSLLHTFNILTFRADTQCTNKPRQNYFVIIIILKKSEKKMFFRHRKKEEWAGIATNTKLRWTDVVGCCNQHHKITSAG